jgi:hypothetical protein
MHESYIKKKLLKSERKQNRKPWRTAEEEEEEKEKNLVAVSTENTARLYKRKTI